MVDVVHGGRRAVIPLMVVHHRRGVVMVVVDSICPGSRHYCLVVLILGSSLQRRKIDIAKWLNITYEN